MLSYNDQDNDKRTRKRFKYINTVILGRKRDPIIQITTSEPEVINMCKELQTETTIARNKVLDKIYECYNNSNGTSKKYNKEEIELDPSYHLPYLELFLDNDFPPHMVALDAAHPWLVYWICNAYRILSESPLPPTINLKIKNKFFPPLLTTLKKAGPFGGGVNQIPHVVANYASILSLGLTDSPEIWSLIDRKAIYEWFLKLKLPNGSISTSESTGEHDVRSIYCCLSVASLLNILTMELVEGMLDFLINCQTFEGGFGGSPGEEAHGGTTFCALASLVILIPFLYPNKVLDDFIDVDNLLRWLSARQPNEEMGLNGRSNKLVDGCYSFWVGGSAAILESLGYPFVIDKSALREYILRCCQSTETRGFRDKPGKRPDFYHTNYVLLGLCCCDSVFYTKDSNPLNFVSRIKPGNKDRGVAAINPVYALTCETTRNMYEFFKNFSN
ncbi:related to Protein farnesyltransferase subunit beta [Saccharomycodes ludwigii]|uniref:Protein farnesyltransferase subunit beta n=1 Tax=Saccharomycodes ludwigii TaxID=36035 RepID=A0A376B6U0_9ASCO|nr:related to Protein farnesyltransferase subunit beta [Saccharomycodes ludwigii]